MALEVILGARSGKNEREIRFDGWCGIIHDVQYEYPLPSACRSRQVDGFAIQVEQPECGCRGAINEKLIYVLNRHK
jgi:hypothetical protein